MVDSRSYAERDRLTIRNVWRWLRRAFRLT